MYSQSTLDNLKVTSCSPAPETLINPSAPTQCLLFGLRECQDVIENLSFAIVTHPQGNR